MFHYMSLVRNNYSWDHFSSNLLVKIAEFQRIIHLWRGHFYWPSDVLLRSVVYNVCTRASVLLPAKRFLEKSKKLMKLLNFYKMVFTKIKKLSTNRKNKPLSIFLICSSVDSVKAIPVIIFSKNENRNFYSKFNWKTKKIKINWVKLPSISPRNLNTD